MRKKTKNVIFSIVLVLSGIATLYSQENYKITFKIKGMADSISYLASYYGDKVISVDTSINKNSTITFEGEKSLPGGIYMLISEDKKKLMELVIDKDRKFTIKSDTSDIINNARAIKTEENELFFKYIKLTNQKHNEIKKYQELLKKEYLAKDTIEIYKTKIQEINRTVIDYKLQFIKDHPTHILSSVFLLIKDPGLPSKNDTIAEDPNLKYRFYKNHYWDGINFSDGRLLQTPVFHKKLDTYFKQVIKQNPDTLIKEIDKTFEASLPSSEMYNYLFWYFIENFDGNEIMGFDQIFVHVANNYLEKDSLLDITQSIKQNIKERANKIEPLLLNNPAPNLILLDTNNQFTSFLRINADFTVILFWDYDCGVCKNEIKELQSFTDTTSISIEVFAVCTDTNLTKWKEFIRKENLNWLNANGTRSITKDYHDLYDIYGTPVIYLLNREKKIIAKRITASQLIPYLQNYIGKHEGYR